MVLPPLETPDIILPTFYIIWTTEHIHNFALVELVSLYVAGESQLMAVHPALPPSVLKKEVIPVVAAAAIAAGARENSRVGDCECSIVVDVRDLARVPKDLAWRSELYFLWGTCRAEPMPPRLPPLGQCPSPDDLSRAVGE